MIKIKRKLMRGDCLERMSEIDDGTVDMVMADPPYGTTACKWDSVVDLDRMWEHLKRVVKLNGAIVLMAGQPFTSILVCSNLKMFKYCWVWRKSRAVGFVNAKLKPMGKHEDVVVFSEGKTSNGNANNMLYNPQNLVSFNKKVRGQKGRSQDSDGGGYGRPSMKRILFQQWTNYPTSVIEFNNVGKPIHPTQKPVALMSYLIKTYTNPGDTVLDFCMGSGTTGVAARQLKRSFIGIEMDKGYYRIARDRIRGAVR